MWTIERLQYEKDIIQLAGIYVEAFSDNNAYRYIFPTDNDGLRWLFINRIRIFLAGKAVFLIARDEDGNVIGGAGCVGNDQKPGIIRMIWHGSILSWPFLWGFDSLSRALYIDAETEKGDLSHCDAELAMVAVKPINQGNGIGKALITALLKTVDETNTYKSIGLRTQKQENLKFYSHFGFKEESYYKIEGFDNWKMYHVLPNTTN
jgi:ribosomal protein S18 acetylase RimI-like enzyme